MHVCRARQAFYLMRDRHAKMKTNGSSRPETSQQCGPQRPLRTRVLSLHPQAASSSGKSADVMWKGRGRRYHTLAEERRQASMANGTRETCIHTSGAGKEGGCGTGGKGSFVLRARRDTCPSWMTHSTLDGGSYAALNARSVACKVSPGSRGSTIVSAGVR